MLQAQKLSKFFGGLAALHEVDIDVGGLEILGVIGPNGAGKTTLFNVVSGFFPPSGGEIFFEGKNITGLKSYEAAHIGIARTFQIVTLFTDLSALDNVLIGFHKSYRTPIWKRLLRTHSAREEERSLRSKAEEILEFMGLAAVKHEIAETLPHGYQKSLSVSMAMATDPKLLLLDEPLAGMNEVEIQMMLDLIRQIRRKGISIVVVEHNMKAIMKLCDRIVVLNHGRKIAEGLPHEIVEKEEVVEAYLGKEEF